MAASIYDGFVSRHLNRRISRPIARALAHTPATPNHVTIFSLGVAAGSLALFAMGYPILAGITAQSSSIIDGVDGDLARLKDLASPFGSFLDAVADRYADAMILGGMTIWAANETEGMLPWVAGFAALAGSFAVTYTRARIGEAHRTMFDRGVSSLASRDIRMLLIMAGAIAGFGVETLLGLAVLTNAVVGVRIAAAWRVLRA